MGKLLGAIKVALLALWQLPQNLAGLFVVLVTRAKQYRVDNVLVYAAPLFGSAVSLGNYIIVDEKYFDIVLASSFPAESLVRTIMHEYGHNVQSRRLGWFYLPCIGLPSLIGNLYSRVARKPASWYYRQPWEAWADELGGVDRSYLQKYEGMCE